MTRTQFLSAIKFACAWAFLLLALIVYFVHPVSGVALFFAAVSIAFAVAPTSW